MGHAHLPPVWALNSQKQTLLHPELQHYIGNWRLLRKIPIRIHFSYQETGKSFLLSSSMSRGTRGLPSDVTLDAVGGGAETSVIVLSER